MKTIAGQVTIIALALLVGPSRAGAAQVAQADAIARAVNAAEEASQREDWAAIKTHLQPVVSQQIINGRMWQLLARAYYYTDDFEHALPAFERVFELRQGIPSTAAYAIAVSHARLGRNDQAMEWLERSVRLGLRSMDDAKTEEAFVALRSDPRFVRLFWTADVSSLPRDQGWRLDLDIIAAEVKRKAVHPFVTRERDRVEWGARLSEEGFDSAVTRLKARVGQLTDVQVGIEIQRLLRQVGDGHTGAFPEGGRAVRPLNLPILGFQFEEGMYIVAAARPYDSLLGLRITAVDGRALPEITKALADLISRDNEQWIPQVLPYQLRNTSLLHALGLVRRADRVTLTLVDDRGETRAVPVQATDRDGNIWNTLPAPPDWVTVHGRLGTRTPRYLRRMGDAYWFEHIPSERAVYFQYNKVGNAEKGESLQQFATRLAAFIDAHDVNKLIVDLRWNNGGNTFLNEAVLHALMRSPELAQPGRTVVIIGRRTFSAAMNLKPIFVGEPTGGKPTSPGDEVWSTLPYSGISFNVSDVLWQAGWPYDVRPWIAPHVHVPPRFADYKSGRDAALEAALAIGEPAAP